MLRAVLAAGLLLAPAAALSADRATPRAEERPGYGIVESIVMLPAPEAQPSASAGASSGHPGTAGKDRYLVRVRMEDGSIQIRSVEKPEVRRGERVLITNAGDIIPE